MAAPLKSIAILGDSLPGLLAAHTLARSLPEDVDILLNRSADAASDDHLYGSVVGPEAYNFLLELGLGEPEIMPATDTTFSLGTAYKWMDRDWIQSFHQPLPVMGGVEFHQYVARAGESYPDYVMGVAAARRGAFAHPPEGQKTPLAALDYGYHILPDQLNEKLLRVRLPERVRVVYKDWHDIDADWIIDARAQLGVSWTETRSLNIRFRYERSDGPVGVVREVTGGPGRWTAVTPFRSMTQTLTVGGDGYEAELLIGRSDTPWTGKRLVLGLAAGALSPLTAAPLTLLIRDVQRLAELIPFSTDMRVEAREYNRRFRDDYDNALLFERAFFEDEHPPRLKHKIAQFESRGALVQYDLEPFDASDWLLLHLGMGRMPAAHDMLADRVPEAQLRGQLATMRRAVETVAAKLPPAKAYHDGLLRYLGKKHG